MSNLIKTFNKKLFNGNLQTSPSQIRLGIWGTTSSGKTIFLAKLYEALLESPNWVVSADKKAREFVQAYLKDMDNTNKEGLLPMPTEVHQQIEIFNYMLHPEFSNPLFSLISSPKIELSFIDAPGEFYENRLHANATVVKTKEHNVNSDAKIFEEEYKDIVEYLMSCDGIIILLDPKRSAEQGESYRTLLFDLFNEFRERSRYLNIDLKRLEQYMAFCVTKVDDDDELWRKGQNPDELAREVMGQKMWKYITNNFCWVELDKEKRKQPHKKNRCEFFAVSAIGRYQDSDGKWRKVLGNYNQENPQLERENNYYYEYDQGYDPDLAEPNNAVSNDCQNFGLDSERKKNVTPQRSGAIKQGVECKPINLIEPIEWLIKSIFCYPSNPIKPQTNRQIA